MLYRIKEITREQSSGETYFLVDFWRSRAAFQAGRPPYLTNDFVMRIRPSPELRAIIRDNIRAYWQRAIANYLQGDHTADPTKILRRKGIVVRQSVTPLLKRDTTDNGIIDRQEIKDLVGQDTDA